MLWGHQRVMLNPQTQQPLETCVSGTLCRSLTKRAEVQGGSTVSIKPRTLLRPLQEMGAPLGSEAE